MAKTLWFALLLCILTSFHATAGVLTIGHDQHVTSLGNQIDALEDRDHRLTIADLRQATMVPLDGQISLGLSKSTWWFRFSLNNHDSKPVQLYLDIGFPQLDLIEFYQPGTDSPVYLGDRYPFQHRPLATRNFVVPFQVQPGIGDYYLKVRTSSSFSVPVLIASPDHYIEWSNREQMIMGTFYGMALALLLYNLFLFVTTRENAYGYLVMYILLTSGYVSVLDGMSFRLFQIRAPWHDYWILIFIFAAFATMMLFAKAYLNIDDNTRLSKVCRGLVYFWIALIPIGLMLPIEHAIRLAVYMVPLGFVSMLPVGFIRLKQHYQMAAYYLVAWLGCLILGILSGLAAGGLIPGFSFFTTVGMKLANVTVMLLLSLGQGRWLQKLKEARLGDQKQLMLARAEADAKANLLANMSHELRTPLNAVLGIVDLFGDTDLDKKQKNYLKVIDNAGKTLLSVINDILDFSRLDAGVVTLENIPTNLEELMEECLSVFRVSNSKSEIVFFLEMSEDVPRCIVCDGNRVRQAVFNLLGNAVKFTEKGRIGILVTREADLDTLLTIKITVVDTGIGISEEGMKKLFQPFSQADPTTTRRYGGTGLGLSICRKLANLLGGEIGVESEVDQGSCFWFTFRGRQSEEMECQRQPSKPRPMAFQNLRVAVAEDNRVNRMVIKGFLKRLGIVAVYAENGQELMDRFHREKHPWDLILMDCEMPEMDGYEATRLIRRKEREDEVEGALIVALTAHAMPEHKNRCFASGMDDHLSKPLKYDQLMQLLTHYFGGQASN